LLNSGGTVNNLNLGGTISPPKYKVNSRESVTREKPENF